MMDRRSFILAAAATLAAKPAAALSGSARAVVLSHGYDPVAQAYFARFATPPSSAWRNLVNTYIVGMRQIGVLSILDATWIIASVDSQSAGLNLVSSSYTLSPVNAPTFTPYRGYAGNGTSSYLNTNFTPSTATNPHFTLNSGHFGLWSRTAGSVVELNGSVNLLLSLNNSNSLVWRTNSGTSDTATNTDGSGDFIANRTGPLAGASFTYRNGAQLAPTSQTGASGIVDTQNIFIGARDVGGAASFSSRQWAMASLGAGLTDTQIAAFYALKRQFLAAIGATT